MIYLGTFSKILSPGLRLGLGRRAATGPGEAQPRQAGRGPLLVVGHAAVCRRVLRATGGPRRTTLAGLSGAAQGALPAPARRDARRAGRALPARARTLDPPAGRPVRLGDAARLHRHDRPARPGAASERVAFVPGRAAYVDGRGGSSMRLNFSGVPTRTIREGIRRIGEVVHEQVGAVRHAHRVLRDAQAPRAAPAPAAARAAGARRCRRAAPPRTRRVGAPAEALDERGRKVAVLKGGRSLERNVSLRSGAPRRGRAERLGHEVDRDRRRLRPRRPAARAAPDVAFVALHGRGRRGRHRPGAAGGDRHPVHRLGPVGVHPRLRQGARQARDARRRHPDARLLRASTRPRSRSSAPPRRCRRSRSASASRSSSSPPARARRSGSSSRARRPTCPAALVAAFSYDRKVLLERYVAGRDLAVSVLEDRRRPRARCRSSRRCPSRRTSTTSSRATRSAAPASSARPSWPTTSTARAQELALDVYRLLGCSRLRARRPDARRRDRRAVRAGDRTRSRA